MFVYIFMAIIMAAGAIATYLFGSWCSVFLAGAVALMILQFFFYNMN